MPLFGEFCPSSRDLVDLNLDSPKSWDDRPNSPKNVVRYFQTSNDSKIARIALIFTIF